MQVITSACQLEDFDASKIVKSLLKETTIDHRIATYVAEAVQHNVEKFCHKDVPASLIRELVCYELLNYGCYEQRDQYARLGMPLYDVTKLITQGSRDNANLAHNPETIHKFAGDQILKEYALTKLPRDVVKAHMTGQIHLHDLDYFMVRPNCLMHDLRWFFLNGLKVDGTGLHTSVAASPKHAMVAVLQAAKILASSQTNMAGGQGYHAFNVFLAPYITELTYKQTKQVMQAFVYEMNQQYVSRGGQVCFSTVNIESTIPKHLEDVPAAYAGHTLGPYSDYYEESLMCANALLDVLLEGDASGKMHLFPNTILHVRDETFKRPEQRELLFKLHQLFGKYGTPYIANHLPKYQHDAVNYMGCRTRLSGDWADAHDRDPLTSTMRTGNLQYVTINLPRIALEAKGNYESAIQILNDRLNTVKIALDAKHNIIEKRLKNDRVLPFLAQINKNGEMYYRFDDVTHTAGFCGLNEFVKLITGQAWHESMDGQRIALATITHMRQWADAMSSTTGLRWTITQSPAETTAGRFAMLDLKEYSKKAIINGPDNAPYYTNSSHVQVDADVALYERATLEGWFHKLCNGGHITHLFMGEGMPNPEGLMSLTEKLCHNTDTGLFDYTKDVTVCKKCGIVSGGLVSSCGNCAASSCDLEYYSRITGYCQRIGHSGSYNGGWNDAKISELRDRKRY